MDIFFRRHGTDCVLRIDYYEFQACIRKGAIAPDDEVKDNVLTKNEWWPVRDLRLFHRMSPTQFEPGRRLQRRKQSEEAEIQAREAATAERAELAAKARKFFGTLNDTDEFVLPAIYGFLQLHDECSLWAYEQAVRFAYFPSFHLPLFVRVSFANDRWELAAARGPSQKSVREVGHAAAARVAELAERANLPSLSPEEGIGGIGMDGATWLLEFVNDGNYVVRKRWSPKFRRDSVPELTGFITLAEHVASLSELLGPNEQMY